MNQIATDNEICPKIAYDSEQGQRVLLVLTALEEMGGENRKQDVIMHIRESRWYDIEKGDFEIYKSTDEPRLHNWLAWARKHAVIRDWGLFNQRDAWALSRSGKQVLDSSRKKFRNGKWDVGQCYLWSARFKQLLDPKHKPSNKERLRPPPRPPRNKPAMIDTSMIEGL